MLRKLILAGCPKVIHPKYYKHLKEAVHNAQSFGQIKKWAGIYTVVI